MMGKKALDAARVLVAETGLEGELAPGALLGSNARAPCATSGRAPRPAFGAERAALGGAAARLLGRGTTAAPLTFPGGAEDFLVKREAILDRLFPDAPLMPGAERLLRHLHASGVPIAVRPPFGGVGRRVPRAPHAPRARPRARRERPLAASAPLLALRPPPPRRAAPPAPRARRFRRAALSPRSPNQTSTLAQVATSSHARHYDVKTQNHKDVFRLFDHIVTGAAARPALPQLRPRPRL
jgi:hypothetical protein